MVAQWTSKLKKAAKEEKGFTLIELLAVIVILGIIAVIAIPMIGNVISKTKSNADLATARQIYEAARLYVVSEKNGDFSGQGSVSLADLTGTGYLEQGLRLPSSKAAISDASVSFDGTGKLTGVVIKPQPEGSTALSDKTGGTYSTDQVMSSEISPTVSPSATTK